MRKTEEILAWGKFVKAFIRILYGISKIVRRSLKSSVVTEQHGWNQRGT